MPISPIWPAATAVNAEGSIEFHGRTAESLLDEFGSPLYLIDTDEVVARARHFVRAAAEAFNTSTTHVSFAGKAFLSKEVVRLVTEAGMFVDTCTMGEMKIALAAGVPGRRLVLHGNNKSDEEIALAIEQGFAKIVIDEPDEPERVAAIARKLGKRARVMLRVTVGVHAGGHEYISTAHEDQKFGVPLLAAGADAAVLDVLNDLKDVTPAATNARISATHSPENGAEKTEKSERELHYDVKYPYDLSHEEIPEKDKALAAAIKVHDSLWESGTLSYDMSQYEIARTYFQWLCDHCRYDNAAADDSASHLAYGALVSGLAVCDGYTGAYNLLLKLEGIECTSLFNNSHIWTLATLDGTQYHIDVTWGDQYGRTDLRYFGMSEEQSYQCHPWGTAGKKK